MTKKDYIKLAEVFKTTRPKNNSHLELLHSTLAYRISQVLYNDNPRFDYIKWEAYING